MLMKTTTMGLGLFALFLILSTALMSQIQKLRWQMIPKYLIKTPPNSLQHQVESRKLLEDSTGDLYDNVALSRVQTQDPKMNDRGTTVIVTVVILSLWKHSLWNPSELCKCLWSCRYAATVNYTLSRSYQVAGYIIDHPVSAMVVSE